MIREWSRDAPRRSMRCEGIVVASRVPALAFKRWGGGRDDKREEVESELAGADDQ